MIVFASCLFFILPLFFAFSDAHKYSRFGSFYFSPKAVWCFVVDKCKPKAMRMSVISRVGQP